MKRLNEKGKSLFQALRYDRGEWCEMGSGEKKRKETEIKKLLNSPSLPTVPSVVYSCSFLFALSPRSELREQRKKAQIFAFNYSRTLYGSFLVIYQLRWKE